MSLCEHRVVELRSSTPELSHTAAVVWWFECAACSTAVAYVERIASLPGPETTVPRLG
jgi:hypothetical protein